MTTVREHSAASGSLFSFSPAQQTRLQRKCACGGSASSSLSDECASCNQKHLQRRLRIGASNGPLEQEADRLADQVMAMPSSVDVSSAPQRIQGFTGRTTGDASVAPTSVDRVLAGPGRPLDPVSQQEMEQRFGHDFSRVRIHIDADAAQSAKDVNADAYTIGRDIVFDSGRFSPGTREGRRLLAHELAHVVQQASTVTGSMRTLVRQHATNTIDARARPLITLAQDTSVAIDQRARRLVAQMLETYYPSDRGKFTRVDWVESNSGVTAICAPTGTPTMTCTMEVGRYFVEHTTVSGIARRVLQIGHEIQHVNQHRQSMGGGQFRHKREFLAFHWEATAPEAAGTGRVPHATRVALIDAAIGNYNCLTTAEKTAYRTQFQQLLTLRKSEQTASGKPVTPVPTQCRG